MIHLDCNHTTFFDVDGTLVDLVTRIPENAGLVIPLPDVPDAWLIIHWKHVEQLKLHKLRQHTIVVWSAGGSDWALNIVKALGLEEYVDLVMAKPTWYYDDLHCSEYMGKNIWIKDE